MILGHFTQDRLGLTSSQSPGLIATTLIIELALAGGESLVSGYKCSEAPRVLHLSNSEYI